MRLGDLIRQAKTTPRTQSEALGIEGAGVLSPAEISKKLAAKREAESILPEKKLNSLGKQAKSKAVKAAAQMAIGKDNPELYDAVLKRFWKDSEPSVIQSDLPSFQRDRQRNLGRRRFDPLTESRISAFDQSMGRMSEADQALYDYTGGDMSLARPQLMSGMGGGRPNFTSYETDPVKRLLKEKTTLSSLSSRAAAAYMQSQGMSPIDIAEELRTNRSYESGDQAAGIVGNFIPGMAGLFNLDFGAQIGTLARERGVGQAIVETGKGLIESSNPFGQGLTTYDKVIRTLTGATLGVGAAAGVGAARRAAGQAAFRNSSVLSRLESLGVAEWAAPEALLNASIDGAPLPFDLPTEVSRPLQKARKALAPGEKLDIDYLRSGSRAEFETRRGRSLGADVVYSDVLGDGVRGSYQDGRIRLGKETKDQSRHASHELVHHIENTVGLGPEKLQEMFPGDEFAKLRAEATPLIKREAKSTYKEPSEIQQAVDYWSQPNEIGRSIIQSYLDNPNNLKGEKLSKIKSILDESGVERASSSMIEFDAARKSGLARDGGMDTISGKKSGYEGYEEVLKVSNGKTEVEVSPENWARWQRVEMDFAEAPVDRRAVVGKARAALWREIVKQAQNKPLSGNESRYYPRTKSVRHAKAIEASAGGTEFEKVTDPGKFAEAVATNPMSGTLTPYSRADIAKMDVFKNPESESYYALKPVEAHPVTGNPELDLVGVINNDSGSPGVGTGAVLDAIERGATTLDAFDGFLTQSFYPKMGFELIARYHFDPAYSEDLPSMVNSLQEGDFSFYRSTGEEFKATAADMAEMELREIALPEDSGGSTKGYQFFYKGTDIKASDPLPDAVYMRFNNEKYIRSGARKFYARNGRLQLSGVDADVVDRKRGGSRKAKGVSSKSRRKVPTNEGQEAQPEVNDGVPADSRYVRSVNEARSLLTARGEDPQFSRQIESRTGTGRPYDPQYSKAFRDPDPFAREVANRWIEFFKSGMRVLPELKLKINRAVLSRVADAFENMKADPEDPAVKSAYRQMMKETQQQYEFILKEGGLKDVIAWAGKGEAYRDSQAMIADVRDNRRMLFYRTINPDEVASFGNSATDSTLNPLLEMTDIFVPDSEGGKYQMTVNDLFTVVHDYFAHAATGNQFGPLGELNAWYEHYRMYSENAGRAMSSETLGQNAWVNFGPQVFKLTDDGGHIFKGSPDYDTFNRPEYRLRREDGSFPVKGDDDFPPITIRPFAEQKVGLMPDEVIQEAVNLADEQYSRDFWEGQDTGIEGTAPQFYSSLLRFLEKNLKAKYMDIAPRTVPGQMIPEKVIKLPDGSEKVIPARKMEDKVYPGETVKDQILNLVAGAEGLSKEEIVYFRLDKVIDDVVADGGPVTKEKLIQALMLERADLRETVLRSSEGRRGQEIDYDDPYFDIDVIRREVREEFYDSQEYERIVEAEREYFYKNLEKEEVGSPFEYDEGYDRFEIRKEFLKLDEEGEAVDIDYASLAEHYFRNILNAATKTSFTKYPEDIKATELDGGNIIEVKIKVRPNKLLGLDEFLDPNYLEEVTFLIDRVSGDVVGREIQKTLDSVGSESDWGKDIHPNASNYVNQYGNVLYGANNSMTVFFDANKFADLMDNPARTVAVFLSDIGENFIPTMYEQEPKYVVDWDDLRRNSSEAESYINQYYRVDELRNFNDDPYEYVEYEVDKAIDKEAQSILKQREEQYREELDSSGEDTGGYGEVDGEEKWGPSSQYELHTPGGVDYTELLISTDPSFRVDLGPGDIRSLKTDTYWANDPSVSHHDDVEPHVLIHSRYAIRDDIEGSSALFIDEIQSDAHQKANQRGGYASEVMFMSDEEYRKAYIEPRNKIAKEKLSYFVNSIKRLIVKNNEKPIESLESALEGYEPTESHTTHEKDRLRNEIRDAFENSQHQVVPRLPENASSLIFRAFDFIDMTMGFKDVIASAKDALHRLEYEMDYLKGSLDEFEPSADEGYWAKSIHTGKVYDIIGTVRQAGNNLRTTINRINYALDELAKVALNEEYKGIVGREVKEKTGLNYEEFISLGRKLEPIFNELKTAHDDSMLIYEQAKDYHNEYRANGVEPTAEKQAKKMMPDYPFKSNKLFGGVMLRRLIREAAARGVDKVAWTSGETQAARNQRVFEENISRIEVTKVESGFKITAEDRRGEQVVDKVMSERDARDHIPGHMVDEAASTPGEMRVYEGENLSIGNGRIYLQRYDKDLVASARRELKNLGIEVRKTADHGIDGQEEVWVFDMTPELRNIALYKGFPMWQNSREFRRGEGKDRRSLLRRIIEALGGKSSENPYEVKSRPWMKTETGPTGEQVEVPVTPPTERKPRTIPQSRRPRLDREDTPRTVSAEEAEDLRVGEKTRLREYLAEGERRGVIFNGKPYRSWEDARKQAEALSARKDIIEILGEKNTDQGDGISDVEQAMAYQRIRDIEALLDRTATEIADFETAGDMTAAEARQADFDRLFAEYADLAGKVVDLKSNNGRNLAASKMMTSMFRDASPERALRMAARLARRRLSKGERERIMKAHRDVTDAKAKVNRARSIRKAEASKVVREQGSSLKGRKITLEDLKGC